MDQQTKSVRFTRDEEIKCRQWAKRSECTWNIFRVLYPAILFILFLPLGWHLGGVQAVAKDQPITIHITDFGINQYWSESMRVGDSFANPVFDNPDAGFHNRAYPELDTQSGSQILIPMPSDKNMRSLSDAELTNRITQGLIKSVDQARKKGVTEFEIQLIQNVRTPGYFDPSRQQLVKRFGGAAYGAIGRMVESIARDQHLVLDTSLASNGAHVFAQNVEKWKHYAYLFRSVDMADGRALLPDMREVLDVLGGERVTITNTLGDYPAPSPLMSEAVNIGRLVGAKRLPPIKASIGNFETTKQLIREYRSMRVFLIKPLDTTSSAHIRRMIDPSARYIVEQLYPTERGVARHQLSGIQSPLDLRNYARSVIAVPATPKQAAAKWSPPVPVLRDIAESLAANVGALSTVLSELGLQDKDVGKPLEIAQRFYDLGLAIERDFQAAGKGHYVLLQSHTLEAASRLTLKKVLKNLGIPDFGVPDIVTAGARNLGSGYADIDTIDSYFIGINKLFWGALGSVVTKSSKGATAFQEYGDALRQLGGAAVLATAKKAFARSNATSIEEMWRTVQVARASYGLKVQTINEFLTPALARQQLSRKDIRRLNSEAASISRDYAPTSKDMTQHYSYSTTEKDSSNQNLHNVQRIEELMHNSNRTVVFGDGAVAKQSYERAVDRHGAQNVRWVHYLPSTLERSAISRKFRADSTITVHQSSSGWREVTRQGLKTTTPILPSISHGNRPSEMSGVFVVPRSVKSRDVDPELRLEILKDRPSEKSLFWEFNKPLSEK